MNKLEKNFHMHTYRCGHAHGEDEEFVLACIDMGMKEVGFSDHIILPDLSGPGMRGEPYQLPDYLESLNNLKQRYKDKIKIHIGFEAEWLNPRYISYYKYLLENKLEYLILGQHCFVEGNSFIWYGQAPNKVEALRAYTHDVIEAMESGLFVYVAHPDIFMSWYKVWDEECEKASKAIIEAAEKLNIPLEINMGQSHWMKLNKGGRYEYPCDKFWEMASHHNIKAIIGGDFHTPGQIYRHDTSYFLDLVEKYKLNVIDNPLEKEEK